MNKRRYSIIVIVIAIVLVVLGICYTNISKNKFLTNKKIIIDYAYGYNIWLDTYLNENYVESLEVKLKGNEAREVKRLLNKLSLRKKMGHDGEEIAMVFNYKLTVEDAYEIYFNDYGDYALYKKGKKERIIDFPKSYGKEIAKIVKKHGTRKKENISTSKIIIKKPNDIDETITDSKLIRQIINKFSYAKVNENKDYQEFEEIANIVDFGDGREIYLYSYSDFGYIKEKNSGYYVRFDTDFGEFLPVIYNNYKFGIFDKLNTNEIIVTYKNKNETITDKNKITEIIEKMKILDYSERLVAYDIYSKKNDDIIVQVGKCKLVIPTNESYGSRYLVIEDKEIYDVFGDIKELENYFKKLVS